MNLTLLRESFPDHTYGVLTLAGQSWQTIERPWVNNTKGVSCVPVGTYRLEKHDSEAHPATWALVNPDLGVIHYPSASLPNARTACLIHPANLAMELRGCIAPGLTRGTLHGQPAVLSSKVAFAQIQGLLPWTDDHVLTVE